MPPALTLERLRLRGEAFMEAISREYWLAHAGHKAEADLKSIYDEYADALGREALELAVDAFRNAAGGEERRSARQLLEWQAESQVGRVVAEQDEREIAWEGTAMVRLPDGRDMPYARIAIEIANTTDRAERLRYDEARAALVARELAPLRRERLARERDFIESLDIAGSYNGAFEAMSGVDLNELAAQCRGLLRDTDAMWRDVHGELVRRTLGIPPGEATRADALALMRAPQFDAHFPAASMESTVLGQVRAMGMDPLANGRVRMDLEERAGKRARAFCAPVRVPDEVHLVLRPHGGQSDWTTFLHELGHALHFAYMRPDLPFEHRWVGDNSITEAYAMLFDHRMQDRTWLARYSELGKQLPAYLRMAGIEELHFLRRYCAKLLYEVELYGGSTSWDALPELYTELLGGATCFRYQPADAFVDVDPRFYSARYLRAWQLQALLNETLTERFDEDWYRNPRAGPWVARELFGEGQRETAPEQAARVSSKRLDFAPLVSAVERLLSA